jgi:hypothetical protein
MRYSGLLVSVLTVLLAGFALPAYGASGKQMTMDITLSDLGDAKTVVTVTFPALAEYNQLKTTFGTNPMLLVRQLIGNRGKSEFENSQCTFNDVAMTVTLIATELGAARNKGDLWLLDAGEGRLRTQQGNLFMFDLDIPTENSLKEVAGAFTTAVNLRVPAGAKNPTFSAAKKRVEYTLAPGVGGGRRVWIGCAGLCLLLGVLPWRFARKPSAAPAAASAPTAAE